MTEQQTIITPEKSPSGNRIRIAIADDQKLVMKGFVQMLERIEDFEIVAEAKNGRELISMIRVMEQIPDICIVDIRMPQMDGFETVSELKELWPKLRVLVLSVFADEDYVIKMILKGINGYLTKNCDPPILFEAIRSIHENEFFLSDEMSENMMRALKHGDLSEPKFTPKEQEFLNYCCQDMTYKEIAKAMGTTLKSVHGFRDSLFRKLELHNRIALVMYAIRTGRVLIDR
ncbi:MAG: response regulator transcription factor [Chitinophagaceae bacterium]|nr:MAG: response regulator transcription factor [Chitinophagaceae bacterium]